MINIRHLSLVILVGILAACSGLASDPEIIATLAPQPTPIPIEVDDPADLGEAIFVARCASCHGVSGVGDGEVTKNAGVMVPSFLDASAVTSQTLQEWTSTIRYGRLDKLMPPWDDALSDAEIAAVADYTYTMWERAAGGQRADSAVDDTSADEAETMGSVTGTITQGTDNAALPAGLSLGLHVLDAENNQVEFHVNDLSEAVERFVFDDVTISRAYSYMVTAVHGDAVFYSETVSGDPGNPEMDLPVTVFEATADSDVIEQDLLVMMLIQEPDALIVQQFMRFQNTSDRVYHTENQINTFAYESLKMTLPEGAVVLNTDALGQRFLILDEGTQPVLIDTRPVLPQTPEIVEIVYALPMANVGGALDVTFPLAYDLVAAPEIFIAPDTHRLMVDGYESQGVRVFDFGNFEQYIGEPIDAGDSVQYRVETLQQPALSLHPLVVILVSAGVALVLVGGFFSLRKPDTSAKLVVSRESLLQDILDLDARYEAGEIDEAVYDARRKRLKQQLAAFVDQEA